MFKQNYTVYRRLLLRSPSHLLQLLLTLGGGFFGLPLGVKLGLLLLGFLQCRRQNLTSPNCQSETEQNHLQIMTGVAPLKWDLIRPSLWLWTKGLAGDLTFEVTKLINKNRDERRPEGRYSFFAWTERRARLSCGVCTIQLGCHDSYLTLISSSWLELIIPMLTTIKATNQDTPTNRFEQLGVRSWWHICWLLSQGKGPMTTTATFLKLGVLNPQRINFSTDFPLKSRSFHDKISVPNSNIYKCRSLAMRCGKVAAKDLLRVSIRSSFTSNHGTPTGHGMKVRLTIPTRAKLIFKLYPLINQSINWFGVSNWARRTHGFSPSLTAWLLQSPIKNQGESRLENIPVGSVWNPLVPPNTVDQLYRGHRRLLFSQATKLDLTSMTT